MNILAYEFADRIRFHDGLIEDSDHKLFIPTDDTYRAGVEVDVLIAIGTGGEPHMCRGKVLGQRAKGSGGRSAGVWIRFERKQLDTVEKSLGALPLSIGMITGREFYRVAARLPITLDKPMVHACETVDISAGGLCLDGLLSWPLGQTVRLSMKIGGESLRIFGRVAWRGEEDNTTGIQFRFHNDEIRNSVADAVAGLRASLGGRAAWDNKVLVVDDDIATVKALQRVLEHREYNVLAATSGAAALSKARSYNPDIILLDVLMTGMNGVEVCRALRADVHTSGIAVLLTSVLPKEELGLLVEESGALGALPKPYRFESLTSIVQAVYDNNNITPRIEPPSEERREVPRKHMPLGCQFVFGTTQIQGVLSNVSAIGAFLPCYWGAPEGSSGKLVIEDYDGERFAIDAKITRRVGWGIHEDDSATPPPGLALSFVGGEGLDAFAEKIGAEAAVKTRRPLIVVVDDDIAHLEILGIILKKSGFDVLTFSSPGAVLDALQELSPDLVILDYMMPGMDGASLCRALRADSSTKALPVWLYSSVGEEHLQQLAADCGADGGLRKGLKPLEFSRRIQEFLAQRESGVRAPSSD